LSAKAYWLYLPAAVFCSLVTDEWRVTQITLIVVFLLWLLNRPSGQDWREMLASVTILGGLLISILVFPVIGIVLGLPLGKTALIAAAMLVTTVVMTVIMVCPDSLMVKLDQLVR
jgi:hypothetical protein